ncbi:MAG: amino acid adenylation domain-containing protein [Candidatus Aminicenantes bacterium]|jgi:amino acid adenylation domain-containing protein
MNQECWDSKISKLARTEPQRIAIKSENRSVSYRELEKKSNRIANFMHKRIEVSPHVIIILNRSPELIESIIGLMKGGLIFVPLDPMFPGNRIKKMIEEAGAEWVITSRDYYEKFKYILKGNGKETNRTRGTNLKVLIIDGKIDGTDSRDHRFYLEPDKESDSLTFERVNNKNCYIYFTSGSTGIPKGVLGRLRSLNHFIQWEINEFGVNESFNISQLTPPSFDPFLRDIYLPLKVGGKSVIPSNDTLMNVGKLIRWIDENEITLMHMVPSLFKKMTAEIKDSNCFHHLKYILLAGELLRGKDIYPFLEIFNHRIQLVNVYGPTETTLAKLFYRIKPGDASRNIIPVGKSIDGAQVLILNSKMQKCRKGKKGEIFIRTPFISSGYLNDPELNKKVFIKNPFGKNPKDIVYKTSDLGRLLMDGNIELTGRVDSQVKIRGIRIELAEIENRLLRHGDIREAVVAAKNDKNGDKYLCAYVMMDSGRKMKTSDLREYLAKYLPGYMIPAYFVKLETMPLTPHGKIDRKSLDSLAKRPGAAGIGKEYKAPQTDMEKKLTGIWKKILNTNKIGLQDNFFELGGDSLKLMTLVSIIHKELNVEVPLMEFLNKPTVEGLTEYINNSLKSDYLSIKAAEKRDYFPTAFIQKIMYKKHTLNKLKLNRDPVGYLVEGRLNLDRVEQAIKKLIQRHEAFRTSFHLINDELMQKIDETVEFKVNFIKCNEKEAQKRMREFLKPFDLSKAPLLRTEVLQVEREKYYLLFDLPHIIYDLISIQIMVREFEKFYKGGTIEPLLIQQKDYSAWQDKMFNEGGLKESETYWFSKLKDFKFTQLSGDRSDCSRRAEFEIENLFIKNSLYNAMEKLCHHYKITKLTFLIAIFKLILIKETGQKDIAIGMRVSNRCNYELEKIFGPFIDKAVVRTKLDTHDTFLNHLSKCNRSIIEAVDNAIYPYDLLKEKIIKKYHIQSSHLFGILVNHLAMPGNSESIFDGEFTINEVSIPVSISASSTPYDIILGIFDEPGRIMLRIIYNNIICSKERVTRIFDNFTTLITKVSRDTNIRVSELEQMLIS